MAAEISRGTSLTMDCTVPGRRPFLLRSGRFTGGGLSLLRGGGLTRLGCVLRRVLSPLPCLITLTAAHWSQAKKAGGNATVLSLLTGFEPSQRSPFREEEGLLRQGPFDDAVNLLLYLISEMFPVVVPLPSVTRGRRGRDASTTYHL